MSSPFRNTFVVATLFLAVLVAGSACQPCPEKSEQTECEQDVTVTEEPVFVHNRVVESMKMTDRTGWKPIKPVTVRRGEGVLFSVEVDTAWIVIPDGNIKKVFGGTEWAKAKSFIAFKVENGSAVVMVPKDYPDSDFDVEIHYSIMARDGTDSSKWDYVHGENPPPRMIIPPQR